MKKTELITQLQGVSQWINQKGWCPATGGNFSARMDEQHFLITASGCDKGQLKKTGFLLSNLQGEILGSQRLPSAEMPVHAFLYETLPEASAILHTHSITATVFSRAAQGKAWPISGYEMQKSISGYNNHTDMLLLPILNNSQDMTELVAALSETMQNHTVPFGFLVRGHGLYAWGEDLATARRHLEGLEFLIACELSQLQLQPNKA
ncbi:MAG: methylthioribulose 1-phosphate dehydratase [Pseudomonadales bacterium]|nr:methylthioribulose 1-phosphate dehydratase [Pseudomonadales bacterium]